MTKNVKLVSITEAQISGETLSPEELIVYTARVSNPSNQLNTATASKLIKYLIENKHWSPFEMVDMTVEITTSRAIAQQILRHRSFSFQEFSQRYSKAMDFEPVELRKQAEKNRQSSVELTDPLIQRLDVDEPKIVAPASIMIEEYFKLGKILYNDLIEAGVAKECARMVLPLTTQTRLYMKGSVRSWIHYLQIRCDKHTQLEHQNIAREIRDLFEIQFPNIHEAIFLQ